MGKKIESERKKKDKVNNFAVQIKICNIVGTLMNAVNLGLSVYPTLVGPKK